MDPGTKPRPNWTAVIVAAVGLLLGGFGIGISVDNGDVVVRVHTKTVTAPPSAIAVDGPDRDTKPDDVIPLGPDAQAEVKRLDQATAGDAAAGALRGNDPTKAGVIEGPLAAQELPGCRTAFVRNFSQRTAKVQLIVWHQTVSHENGLSSQNALTARANDPATQVSWTALVGRSDGLCTYTVPLPYKAWAQGNANSVSAGIEVEALGDEPSYVEGLGKAKLFSVTRYIAKAEGIPIQHAQVSWSAGCIIHVIRPGILEHRELGQCGGGHLDVCSSALCRSGGPESAELAAWRIEPLIEELAREARPCKPATTCPRAAELRAKHLRTHQRFAKNHCSARGPKGRVRGGYCDTLRHRNRAVHEAARREHVSLAGTYR